MKKIEGRVMTFYDAYTCSFYDFEFIEAAESFYLVCRGRTVTLFKYNEEMGYYKVVSIRNEEESNEN